jgi:hypothetical protein
VVPEEGETGEMREATKPRQIYQDLPVVYRETAS